MENRVGKLVKQGKSSQAGSERTSGIKGGGSSLFSRACQSIGSNQGSCLNSSKLSVDLHARRLVGSLSRNCDAVKPVWEKGRKGDTRA